MSKGCPVTSETHIIWVPLNCWFGSVVWNLGTSLWKGLLLRGTLRIPSHRAPNQQSTTSWIPVFTQQWESISVSFVDFFLGGVLVFAKFRGEPPKIPFPDAQWDWYIYLHEWPKFMVFMSVNRQSSHGSHLSLWGGFFWDLSPQVV